MSHDDELLRVAKKWMPGPMALWVLAWFALIAPAPAQITRREVMKIAESYASHPWKATKANIAHREDAEGVRIDTPDMGFRPEDGTRPGWWKTDGRNVGVPYQWGGFCTLAEFDAGVRAGLAAGDVYTEAKRAGLDDAVSKHAVGIDCSGFVSRCWGLTKNHSTRELPQICDELKDAHELRPGDIMNLHNAHVLIFAKWTDATQTRFEAYETGCPPTWKVLRIFEPLATLLAKGYKPYRYREIRD